jgi:hypothetical protein
MTAEFKKCLKDCFSRIRRCFSRKPDPEPVCLPDDFVVNPPIKWRRNPDTMPPAEPIKWRHKPR